MPRLTVGDIAIHYELAGEGPTLVLVHGLACGARMWIRQRALRRRFRVLTYDQRGHGLTDAPDDPARYAPDRLARDLAGLLDALDLGPVHLVGFSMGGGPALALAASRPDRVRSLVLADVGASGEDPWRVQWLATRWAALAEAGDRKILVEEMLRGDFFKSYANASPRGRRHMGALLASHPLHGLRHTFLGVLAKRRSPFRTTGTLAALRVPTLVLVGQHDYVCLKSAKHMAASIPGARLLRIPGAGHMVPLEAPTAFDAALADFVAANEPA